MKVTVTFLGILRQEAGRDTLVLDLPAGAVFGDVLDAIGRQLGDRLGNRVWNAETRAFRPGVNVIGEGRALDSRTTPLKEGESIQVLPVVGGG